MKKKQNEALRRQEDAALNRALLWVGGAIVLEALLLLLKRHYIDFDLSSAAVDRALLIRDVLAYGRILAAVAALGCLVWAFLQMKAQKSAGLPLVLAIVAGAVAVCAHVAVAYRESGVRMLFLLVAAWAGLALVYYLYQKEFFLAAIGTGLGVLGLWFARFGGGFCLESLATLLALVLVLAVIVLLRKEDGQVKLAGLELSVLSKGTNYPLVLGSTLAALVAVIAACLMGATAAYYLTFVMIAWLFGLLVYYTVKMM